MLKPCTAKEAGKHAWQSLLDLAPLSAPTFQIQRYRRIPICGGPCLGV